MGYQRLHEGEEVNRLRLGLLLLAMAGMVAWLFHHQANKVSRHEWRNSHSERFEQDFGEEK